MKGWFHMRHVLASVGATAAALAVASTVVGASTVISANDPTAGVATILTVDYQTSVDTQLYVKYRPTGGAACAPTARDDTGGELGWYQTFISGAGRKQMSFTFPAAGTFQVCVWFSFEPGSLPIFATSQQLAVRSVRGTLQISAPPRLAPGQSGVLTFSGQTEDPRYLYASIRPAGGAACAATASDDSGERIVSGSTAEGTFSIPVTWKFPTAGTFQLCAWLASSSRDSNTLAIATGTVTVVAPPRPKATSVRVSARPGVSRVTRPFQVIAFVSSRAGSPTGSCAVDRQVRHQWQPYATVRFGRGQACRVRVFAGSRGAVRFRVRYVPDRGWAASTGFSNVVFVRR